jgi:hypothetical protein
MKMEIWDLMEMAFDFSRVDDVTFFAFQILIRFVEYELFESFLAKLCCLMEEKVLCVTH